ncbi:MAG: acyl-CoA thioesterase [Spirochaetota bacterium]
MSRVRLAEQKIYPFKYECIIRVYDVNMSGHVGTTEMVALLHQARHQLLRNEGLHELNLGDGETSIIMADMVLNFKKEIFLDDNIIIESKIDEITEKGFRFFHRVMKDGHPACLAESGAVAFNFQKRVIGKIPSVFLEKFAR